MQNRLQINPFTINELSPIGFIAERWEFHENKRVGNKIKIPFSFLGLTAKAFMIQETLKHLKKLRNYERDRLEVEKLNELNTLIEEIEHDYPTGWNGFTLWLQGKNDPNPERVKKIIEQAEVLSNEICPPKPHSWIAENVDVILVALVVAIGIRSYFIQPFKIPTNSMFPTLRGIVITPKPEEDQFPSTPQKMLEKIFFGRDYIDFTIPANARFLGIQSSGFFLWKKTDFYYAVGGDEVAFGLRTEALPTDLIDKLRIPLTTLQRPVQIKGTVDTGDHLFVNKVIYNFQKPQRGEAFVFKTTGLATDYNLSKKDDENAGSQYYIKRCVGTGKDRIRVEPPYLYVNDKPAQEPWIKRVWTSGDLRYKGYSNGSANGQVMNFLKSANEGFEIPGNSYWAMGDNSYNSADSRQFGPVPRENVIGRAWMIYYPFNRKFWWIE